MQDPHEADSTQQSHDDFHSPTKQMRSAVGSPGSPVNRPASAALSLRSFGRPATSRLLSAKTRPATKSPRKIKANPGQSISPTKSASAAPDTDAARKASAVITKPWSATSGGTHAEVPQQENERMQSAAKPSSQVDASRTSAEPRQALQESPSTYGSARLPLKSVQTQSSSMSQSDCLIAECRSPNKQVPPLLKSSSRVPAWQDFMKVVQKNQVRGTGPISIFIGLDICIMHSTASCTSVIRSILWLNHQRCMQGSKEFIYMIPATRHAADYHPYDLKIVPHTAVASLSDYSTMSAAGVTHFFHGQVSTDSCYRPHQSQHLQPSVGLRSIVGVHRHWPAYAVTWAHVPPVALQVVCPITSTGIFCISKRCNAVSAMTDTGPAYTLLPF